MKKVAFIVFLLFRQIVFAQVWGDVSGGVTYQVPSFCKINSLKWFNNELYASGEFDTAGVIPSYRLARWNQSNWDSVGLGFGYPCAGCTIYDYCEINGELYAGGYFPGFSSGLPFPNNHIPNTTKLAKWNGTNWLSVSADTPGDQNIASIYSLAYYNNELYAGGTFVQVGTLPVNRIAKWNGTNWSGVGGGVIGGLGSVTCMTIYNGDLFVSGDFIQAGGISAKYIARWNGLTWDSLAGGLNYAARCMLVDTINNVLYVAGGFTRAGTVEALGVAKWDGVTWSSVGTDTLYGTRSISIYHNELYAGGSNTIMAQNGEQLNNIYRWDGNEWHSVLGGTNNTINALTVFNDTLYVAGYFDSVNTVPMNRIARYYDNTLNIDFQLTKGREFSISPNPASQTITIKLSNEQLSTGNAQLSMYDIYGREVYSHQLETGNRKEETKINISHLSNGVYFVKAGDVVGKFVKQ